MITSRAASTSRLARAAVVATLVATLSTWSVACGSRTGLDEAASPVVDASVPEAGPHGGRDSGHEAGVLVIPDSGEGVDAPPACVPACSARACGDADGCGGRCNSATCGEGEMCSGGACVPLVPSVVLVGGFDSTTDLAQQTPVDLVPGTWTSAGDNWTMVGDAGPSARWGPAMATLGDSVVLFGGSGFGATPEQNTLPTNDTWTYDGATWTQNQVTGPLARTNATAATAADTVVLFGGENETVLGDTWTWDGAAWTPHVVIGPTARQLAASAGLHGTVVLFGGLDETKTSLGDTWTWDGTTWTARDVPGPPARFAAVMATVGETVVLFGGLGAGGVTLDDTWTWDGSAWTLETPTESPPSRAYAVAAPLGDRVLVYGGADAESFTLFDMWIWDGAAWTAPPFSTGPGRRWYAAMAGLP